jgi:hypothetical protein
MNDGQMLKWSESMGRCLIPKGSLKNKLNRDRFFGGAMKQCFFECRIPGEQELEIDMGKWMLREHKSSISNEEFAKYLKVFKTLDQKLIDEFLDNEQN